jgi:photosystem II stability/assembly factor-like uncharacterized protein
MAVSETDIETRAILALATSSTGRLFAASLSGLRVRESATSDWELILPRADEPAYPVTAIAIAPNGAMLAGVPGGFGLSHDDGVTWSFVALPDPIAVITCLAISSDNQLVLAGSEQDGVFRSVDGGASWTAWNFGLLDAGILSLAISENESIYAGTTTGLFVSRNHGRAWEAVPLTFDFDAVLSLAVQGPSIFIGTESNGLWVSSDGASSWVKCIALPDSMIQFLATDNDAIVASGESGLWLSNDSGDAWSAIESHITNEITSISPLTSAGDTRGVSVGSADGNVTFITIPSTAISS